MSIKWTKIINLTGRAIPRNFSLNFPSNRKQAQKNQQQYKPVFSSLLRLLITHFPHLSLVDDWMDENNQMMQSARTSTKQITQLMVVDAFEHLKICPSKTIKLLRFMLTKNPSDIWPLGFTLISYLKLILDDTVPRLSQEFHKQILIKLNTILPRHLWVMTINALMPDDTITNHFRLH